MKKKIFIWCSDIQNNNGEGILANKYLDDLKKYNKNYIFYVKTLSSSKTKFLRSVLGNTADRFLFPFFGVLYLWFVFIFKQQKKICYVNYLPLWNFILFMFLPPKTILGPITGGSKYLKKPYTNYFLRKFILNFLCLISVQILKLRNNKLLFSTDLLKNKFINFKKKKFNYVFKDFKFEDKNLKRKYDIIFYIRSHSNKNTFQSIELANSLSNKFKIVTIGKKIRNKNIINMGNLSKKDLNKILQKTKCSFLSSENIYSFFSLDCLSNGVHVFYHNSYRPLINLKKNMTPINYYRNQALKKIIKKKLKQLNQRQKKIYFKKNLDFMEYLKI
ncbi:hypothetical protein [Candidatus Pelagibacter sp.]|uniref:hypothetical protein n=1 Tax=Candidatus Pelagibacter sp. TaxID=2024849 RepID=UPI003F85ABA2